MSTVNPYRLTASSLVRRVTWDLNPESWRSRRRLQAARDSHRGETAVILCNGPSLLKVDFGLLGGTFTFGLNKINLLFEKTSMRPGCIVSVNRLVIEQNADFYRKTSIPLFLDRDGREFVRPADHVTFLDSGGLMPFAKDVSMSLWQGHTVTYVAMQLAFHMGFSRLAVVGCDHNFPSGSGKPNEAVTSGATDANHFDPRYFAGGVKWQLPDLRMSEVAYTMALDAFQRDGRELVNCTFGGKLEILPRMELAEFLR